MTNNFVYGAFIHLDIYLWKIRNIIKNLANFALTGLVLYSIIKWLIGKGTLNIKKIITNTLIAWILIQASRFLMWAVIDVSTIATTAIGAFPTSFFKTDTKLQSTITAGINRFRLERLFVNFYATGVNDMIHMQKETWPINTATRESILPNQNSVSWPFIYLGMGIFDFQNYITTENNTELAPLTLGFALRFFLLFLFTVWLLLLLIANIMRIGLLRIFIIWSPVLILSQVFDIGKWKSWWFGELFSVWNLIATIFKPVIFVAGISMMLIVIVSMQNSISGSWATRENNLNGVSLSKSSDTVSNLSIEWISNISVDQKDILGKDVIDSNALGKTQNFFSHLIMLLLTIFLMRQFIKLSLTMGGWTITKTMEKLISDAEGIAKTMPILPWWIGVSGASSIMQENKKKLFGWFWLDTDGNFGEMNKEGRFTKNSDAFQDLIDEKVFGTLPRWKDSDSQSLKKIAETWDSERFFSKSRELAKTRNWWVSVTTPWRIQAFEILSTKKTPDWFTGGLSEGATEEQIATYFNEWNTKALYNALWWYDASRRSEPKDYNELKNISFHAGK